MISIRRISVGGGFRYLMSSVARQDGVGDKSLSLESYYAASGTPPGRFLGRGLAELNSGNGVLVGSLVGEEHLRNMLVACADPVSGEQVGSAPRAPRGGLPVAGFDLTFSPSKSISTMWALADDSTRRTIYACHRRAIDFVLAYAEAEVFHSRSGVNGIVEEDVTGVVAAAFTHWASRADDPQLHDHVVIWNRAKSVSDGKWRTLDSRAIFKALTTLSELHQGVLSDYLTEALGVGWEARKRRHSERPRFEIAGVPEKLMAEFSQRSEQIASHNTEKLRSQFRTAHGRDPSPVENMRLLQRSTIETRPDKSQASLAELVTNWRSRAAAFVAEEGQLAWVRSLAGRNDLPLLHHGDLAEAILSDAARSVVKTVAEHHATFTRLNLAAEAHRVLHGVRFATPDDRVAVAEKVTQAAVAFSLRLSPPALHHTPERYRRADGSSRLDPANEVSFTTHVLLEAEARLLAAGKERCAPVVEMPPVTAPVEENLPEQSSALGIEQARAVDQIVTSSRVVDVLVGPAGTGKSRTMAGLRSAWEAVHGSGSVIGLAPSAAAAQVLSEELGVPAENTAKWLVEHRRVGDLFARRERTLAALARRLSPSHARNLRNELAKTEEAIARRALRPGQLVLIDEASMAGTFVLDEIVEAAKEAGAKVLLVGDPAQIGSVAAGGAFSLLVSDRSDLAPSLVEVRRFQSEWEGQASIELREGSESAIEAYEAHGRITGGDRESLLDAVYAAWSADVDSGKSSLMIAGDLASVAELNGRARRDGILRGAIAEVGIQLAGGQVAGVGDLVMTRKNNRAIGTATSWVKNGDRFEVVATNDDGSMVVRRVGGRQELLLPQTYVEEHVELAYATTAHRAQGRTVDTAHAMVSPATTREILYVSTTRGRESNHLYVDTSYDPDPLTGHDGTRETMSAHEVLAGVLANEGAELSAHETLRREHHQAENFATLTAEYQSLAADAQGRRFEAILAASGLSEPQLDSVRMSEARGPLFAAMRHAESYGADLGRVLPRLVGSRSLADAEDVAAMVHGRVERWIESAASTRRVPDLVAGLLPRARGVTDTDMAQALA